MPVNKNNGYHTLSKDLSERIEQDRANHWVNPYACPDSAIIRRFDDHDKPHLWRPAFVMDVEKILHNNYYNRYSDKTQVISCYKMTISPGVRYMCSSSPVSHVLSA